MTDTRLLWTIDYGILLPVRKETYMLLWHYLIVVGLIAMSAGALVMWDMAH